jgi:hypothetical protein
MTPEEELASSKPFASSAPNEGPPREEEVMAA